MNKGILYDMLNVIYLFLHTVLSYLIHMHEYAFTHYHTYDMYIKSYYFYYALDVKINAHNVFRTSEIC